MKKLLLLPTMLFPYFFVLGESEDDLQLEKILVFGGLFLALSLICNVIYMVLARNEDPRKLMGGALLVKLIHIPAYVMIFFYGAVASLMFFMALPLIIMYVVFDYIVLLLSSSLSVFGLVKNMKKEYFAPEVKITYVSLDIITYSETEEWEGPIIKAGQDDQDA